MTKYDDIWEQFERLLRSYPQRLAAMGYGGNVVLILGMTQDLYFLPELNFPVFPPRGGLSLSPGVIIDEK